MNLHEVPAITKLLHKMTCYVPGPYDAVYTITKPESSFTKISFLLFVTVLLLLPEVTA